MKNSKFNELVSQMEVLTENEQGVLKGGYTTLPSSSTLQSASIFNFNCKGDCTFNIGYCPKLSANTNY